MPSLFIKYTPGAPLVSSRGKAARSHPTIIHGGHFTRAPRREGHSPSSLSSIPSERRDGCTIREGTLKFWKKLYAESPPNILVAWIF